MALKTFKFGIGEGYQEISLPEEHILQVIEGNEVPKLDDVQAATIEALRNPINSKPLQEVVSKGEKSLSLSVILHAAGFVLLNF